MTRWPTLFDSHVCPIPSAPVTIGMATMPPTSSVSRRVSFCGIAVSRTPRSRNGEIMPSPAETKISASRPASGRRYGLKRLATRLGKRCRRGGRLEGEVQDLADRHHRVEGHLLPYILGHVVQIGAVSLRQDHVGQSGGVRRQHLLL